LPINGRSIGLAYPLLEMSTCLETGLIWLGRDASEKALDGFYDLVETIGFPKAASVFSYDDLARKNILETIANSPTVFGKKEAAWLVGDYGDDALELFARYTDDGCEALAVHGQKAVDLLKKYGDDPIRSSYIGSYLENIRSARAFEFTNVNLVQGFEVSYYAQLYGVDIHIAGRLSDTPAEAAIKMRAAVEAESLIKEYLEETRSLPDLVQKVVNKNIDQREEIITMWGKREIGDKYGIAWYQVKASSGYPEADVFISKSQWNALSASQQGALKELLGHTFEVPTSKVDLYQVIKPEDWEELIGGTTPGLKSPPGAIKFMRDSSVIHTLFEGL
jgi:hypothetical protein